MPKQMKRTRIFKGLGKQCSGISRIAFYAVIFVQLTFFVIGAYAAEAPVAEKENVQLGEKWGIEIVGLRLSAAGHVIDLRYRVTDPKKALPFFDAQKKPSLIDQASGVKMVVPVAPKIGSMRQKTMRPEVGRIYFMLFGNTGVVNYGSKVTLVIGDIKIENLTVEAEAQPARNN